jgi:hypothetical protein
MLIWFGCRQVHAANVIPCKSAACLVCLKIIR